MKIFESSLRWISSFILFGMILGIPACKQGINAKISYCTPEDFMKMEKIDIHCHISVERHSFMEQAIKDNFRILTINTDAFVHPTIEEQQDFAIKQIAAFPGHLHYLTAFNLKGWDEPGWKEKTIAYLDDSFKKGAIGIKVWKNIGMVEKDKNGKFIMIDDPKFDPIFDYL